MKFTLTIEADNLTPILVTQALVDTALTLTREDTPFLPGDTGHVHENYQSRIGSWSVDASPVPDFNAQIAADRLRQVASRVSEFDSAAANILDDIADEIQGVK